MLNTTFYANRARVYGGGMINTAGSRVTIANTIMWGDVAYGGAEIYNAAGSGGVYNVTDISYSNIQGCFSGSAWFGLCGNNRGGNIHDDPYFVDPFNGNLRLLVFSPSIDKGKNSALPSSVTEDLAGNERIVDSLQDGDPTIDMGAYEFQGLVPVGFPPGEITPLAEQLPQQAYTSTEMYLEIPSLGLRAPIVGVSYGGEGWETSWLKEEVGWLVGSAFPTWNGNTVLAGHVWNADNTPGLFSRIKELQYGTRFIIHAFGKQYIYEVRENKRINPQNVQAVFQHEELDWVTLLTCENYDPQKREYRYRRLVRAVLVAIK